MLFTYFIPALLVYLAVKIFRSEDNRVAVPVYVASALMIFWIAGIAAIFKKGAFWEYFRTTLVFVSLTVSIQLVLGMLLALLLNSNIKGQKFFRGLFIIPWTIPSVVVAILWIRLFLASRQKKHCC